MISKLKEGVEMGFGITGLRILKEIIDDKGTVNRYKMHPEDFTRNRKIGATDLIYYSLNRKGLCTAMETNNYFAKAGKDESITAQSLFNQRLKLRPEIFVHLNDVYLSAFYSGCEDEVKLYKGYVLKAVDGSDLEVPNTGACIEKYGIAKNHHSGVARAAVSTSYDLLNHYLLDGTIDSYRTSEISMTMRHIERAENLTNPYPSIYIMDRNYVSISFMTFMMDKGVKFLCRLKTKSHYLEEIGKMKTDDEIIFLKHTKHRLQRSRFHNEELFQMAKSQSYTRVRVVKHTLPTGEIESLMTNVEDLSHDEIVELYHLRWGIETMYGSLKGKLQIEKFTSSIQQLIEQDFFSSILAYNIIQSARNEANNQIIQEDYKYEMKTNENMAIGFVKNDLLTIMLEDDDSRRCALFDKLITKICRHKIPIRPNRTFPRRFKTDNINSINKLKTF